ncbi:unnamed protein product [Orchesella dallaii]|uniref:Fatty acid desaturase domain-containing protein n=1 Tax=Orchesella dallaii TaxID=48710 RepID=A0ABP1QXR7_9HEXA
MGNSGTMWRRRHNVHHAMPQRIGRDIDLDNLPVLLINIKLMDDPNHANHLFYRYQGSGGNLCNSNLLFVCILNWVLALGKFTNCIAISYLFFNFGLSHTHLPVTDKPTHWVEHGLVHTADVDQRPWCDWWMGYLNYQIEHHLFPTMPQFRNKLAVNRVRAFAKNHGVPYHVHSHKEAVMRMMYNIWDVTQQVKRFPLNS